MVCIHTVSRAVRYLVCGIACYTLCVIIGQYKILYRVCGIDLWYRANLIYMYCICPIPATIHVLIFSGLEISNKNMAGKSYQL